MPIIPFRRPHALQRGAATVAIAFLILLILAAAVAASLSMSGSAVRDSALSEEQVAALFLAESGVERAQKVLADGFANYNNTVCTSLSSGGPFSFGRGTFNLTGTSTPATCTGNACTTCTVQSVGIIGNISRTIEVDLGIGSVIGRSCNATNTDCTNSSAPPPTWSFTLRNSYPNTSIALFSLASEAQGDTTGPYCTADGNCVLKWLVSAVSSGTNAAYNMGNVVTIPAGESWTIYQTFDSNKNKNLAEVGALFPGSGTPEAIGFYWDNRTPGGDDGTKTKGQTGLKGQTNNGTLTSTGTCSAPSVTTQACTNWCYGGDRLVFGFGAKATSLSDGLSSVTFNCIDGNPPDCTNGVPLSKVAKFPEPTTPNAPTDIYSEVWQVGNANLTPSTTPEAVNVSSYKGWSTTASMGASFSGRIDDGTTPGTAGNVLTVTGMASSRVISPGDTLTGTGVLPNTTIQSPISPTEGGNGQYLVSNLHGSNAVNGTLTTASTVLFVSGCTICFFAPGDVVKDLPLNNLTGRTISSQETLRAGEAFGGIGRYVLDGAQANTLISSTPVWAGTPGTTIYLPSTSSVPSVTTPAMRVAVKSGTGQFQAGTTVTAVSAPNSATNAFTVTATPTPEPSTPLELATICAGTCALFSHTTTKTTFTFVKSLGTAYWASGFMCIKGSDIEPETITSSENTSTKWREVVR